MRSLTRHVSHRLHHPPARPATGHSSSPNAYTQLAMGKRFRACEACHALKIKCDPSLAEPGCCERCVRTSTTCVPAARRWQRDRIQELEAQVAQLQLALDETRAASVSAGRCTRDTSVGSSDHGSGDKMLAFLDALVDLSAQARALTVYAHHVHSAWPVISLGTGTSDSQILSMRDEFPITLVAILAFALTSHDVQVDAQTQQVLRQRVADVVGAAMTTQACSHDLIQASLVAAFWVRPAFDTNCYRLIALAIDMGVDFGLGGDSMPSSPPAWFGRHRGPLSPGMARSWLGAYVGSKFASISTRRQDAHCWGPSHDSAFNLLEQQPEGNHLLLEITRIAHLQATLANDLALCDANVYRDMNSEIVRASRSAVRERIEAIERNLPPWLAQDHQLRFLRLQSVILSNEPVLHTTSNKAFFGAPYIAARIGVHDFACPDEITPVVQDALLSLVRACHDAIDVVARVPTAELLNLTTLCFASSVTYNLALLVKVHVAVSAPGNSYGQIMTRQQLNVRQAMEKLKQVNAALVALDPRMDNWNTRIIGAAAWLETWLVDYESIVQRFEHTLQRGAAEEAMGSLSPSGFF
ncbi:cercosporin resistance [Emericellopsis cladophorae]|uniref:Cercosporin resistance n=1 Tax=Emericellopsis cladophorae TaxID=2686198 RepID=A0A9P9XXW6_9HYPO|nr:cercosporin resistance [Emericellopsis cladophorae]KAI6779339.1 cercosporin resistance [Emericellopsis cladophorae]